MRTPSPLRSRIGVIVALASTLLMAAIGGARAGGAWMTPVADRYEPGDNATMVGYFERGVDGAQRPVFISAVPFDEEWNLPEDVERIEVGVLTAARTHHGGYLSYRATTTFQIPAELVPGVYDVNYDWDNGFLGDLIGGSIWVGMDPGPDEIVRDWAADEPEIANLSDDAVLALVDGTITAGELRLIAQGKPADGQTAPAIAEPVDPDDANARRPGQLPVVEEGTVPLTRNDAPLGLSPGWALGSAALALGAIGLMVWLAKREPS